MVLRQAWFSGRHGSQAGMVLGQAWFSGTRAFLQRVAPVTDRLTKGIGSDPRRRLGSRRCKRIP